MPIGTVFANPVTNMSGFSYMLLVYDKVVFHRYFGSFQVDYKRIFSFEGYNTEGAYYIRYTVFYSSFAQIN